MGVSEVFGSGSGLSTLSPTGFTLSGLMFFWFVKASSGVKRGLQLEAWGFGKPLSPNSGLI